jgi:Flp pilus assembly protein TadG
MTVRPRRSGRRDDRGASAVEFALVLPFLLVIVFGLIQYGLYFFSSQTGSNTVNVAARQLTVGNCDTDAELNTLVNNRLGSAQVGTATVVRNYFEVDGTDIPGNSAADAEVGGTVKVEITFDSIDLNFPFVPFLDDAKVYRTVTARVEDTTDQGCGS